MEQDLVRYSGAGTAFHYRWAARRCLKLLDPGSGLERVFIEGSEEPKLGGECSIDLAEYLDGGEIRYFQLKHTTTRMDTPFRFSDLKSTLKRFLERFAADQAALVTFHFVTNRPVSEQFKDVLTKIAEGKGRDSSYMVKLQKLTPLDSGDIERFCTRLHICDSEGDFRQQKNHLRKESAPYFTSAAESAEMDSLIALVAERALPAANGKELSAIIKEEVLSQFGIASEKVLFPAEPTFDLVSNPQKREFQDDLVKRVLRDESPLIVRASGGVGKTVVAQQLVEALSHPHKALVYDCFGNGSYRNPSEPRHPSRVALVQIANELARDGLCSPLLPRPHDGDHALFASFKDRLIQAVTILRERDPSARLILIIDAADNSEMAAEEREEKGFAKLLFRENLPEGCKLVAFSRPGKDRAELLQPPPNSSYYDLPSFTPAESLLHLRSVFASATSDEGEEFHKLSQGNPRVQAFALDEETSDVNRLLVWLGPGNLTVEDIIRGQLDTAVANLNAKSPKVMESQITSVCRCLATLPPCIPKEILASAAKLETSDIESFVADLGRPLWISENLVYFRDEPTESWFRDNFAAETGQVSEMVEELMPLAETSAYVARALPALLHRAKMSDELLALALSDDGLPRNAGAAEIKEITIQRTQFAFKAALRGNRLLDACKLAFKAAEEMAGTERVDELLQRNSDFIGSCLSPAATQELALSRRISAGWTGSSNIYTALLLSAHDDFRGQALSFLRSSRNWLVTFMEEVRKRPKDADHRFDHRPSLQVDELAAMAGAILNLEGIARTVDFLVKWKPKQCTYEITTRLAKSLVDMGRINDVRELMQEAREEPHVIVGCCEQLIGVCLVPDPEPLGFTLEYLSDAADLIEMPGIDNMERQHRHLPLVAFCEAASANNLEPTQVLGILRKICDRAELRNVSHYRPEPRTTFFRAHSLRMALSGQCDFKNTDIWKAICKEAEDHANSRRDELPKLSGEYLFPWFLRRARTLSGLSGSEKIHEVPTGREMAYKVHDAHLIGYEAACVWAEVLGFSKNVSEVEFSQFQSRLLTKTGERLRMVDTIHAARIIFRHKHLSSLEDGIEEFFHRFVAVVNKEPEEESSDDQVCFAKAIFPVSKPDAEAHFGRAIEATSKFGYELNERWSAILAVATRAASGGVVQQDLCQRFFNSAEVVSEGIAREKYWDRCETFAIGLEMNPTVALAAWSRWRDRRLISYRPTLHSMAIRAIEKMILPPATVWPLTAFLECNASAELHADCFAAETEPSVREAMRAVALRDLRLAGASRSDFETLSQVVGDLPELSETPLLPGKKATEDTYSRDASENEFEGHVSLLLESCDVGTREGLRRAIKGMKEIPPIRYSERFWSIVIKAVPRNQRKEFLTNLVAISEFDFHDLTNLLPGVRQWKNSASIEDYWSVFLEEMGAKFPEKIFSLGSMEYYVDGGFVLAAEFECLQRGIFSTFSETTSLHKGTVFLGFVTQCVAKLTGGEARELLDFALERMELHIADDFGEGRIEIPEETLSPISGLLWSSLGSPYANERWQAMHAVRRLFLTKNQREIDHLLERMKAGEVGIYGCKQYDFYLLHARLYLLTALNRAAMDDCEPLKEHLDTLRNLARSDPAHLLIQRTASEICLKISQQDPSLMTSEELQELSLIGHSPYPLEKTTSRSELKDAPWDSPKTSEERSYSRFDIDFGPYWFDQLQSLFGVGRKHIEHLAKFFIETSLGKPQESDHGWLTDTRSGSRSNHRSRSENFQHSHGVYPSADTLDFYCEYHSFLHAAARLLETTPVIREELYSDYERDPLNSWLRRHKLTLDDGTWLYDRRDSAPRTRRKWTSKTSDKEWKANVEKEEFQEILHESMAVENWVVLHGNWTDCNDGAVETLRVKSALVQPEAADSLGRFLSSQESPYDFALPQLSDDESTFSEIPFVLLGIVQRSPEDSFGLSSFDPHAGDLPYPPLEIGAAHAETLNIKPDSQAREWRKSDSGNLVMKSEIWNQQGDETGKIYPSGQRIGAEQALLTELCEKTGMDLIFCVEIHRHYEHESSGYFREEKDEHGRGLHFKIFILSADGKIREAQDNN